MTQPEFSNPFLDFLETDVGGRRGAFINAARRQGVIQRPRHEQQIIDLFSEADALFNAELAQQIQSGEAPTLSAPDFFNQDFDFAGRLARQAGLGAQSRARFNPRNRFIAGF